MQRLLALHLALIVLCVCEFTTAGLSYTVSVFESLNFLKHLCRDGRPQEFFGGKIFGGT